jgi:hypothetical protein
MEEQLPPMFVQWMTLFFFFILWSFLKRRKEALNYTLAEKTLGKQQQQAPDIRDFFVQIISLTWDSPLLVGETLFLRASLTCQLVCCWRGENKEKDGGIIYTHTSLERC